MLVGFFSIRTAFPSQRVGRHPELLFRGLLKLHSRYEGKIAARPSREHIEDSPSAVKVTLVARLSTLAGSLP